MYLQERIELCCELKIAKIGWLKKNSFLKLNDYVLPRWFSIPVFDGDFFSYFYNENSLRE